VSRFYFDHNATTPVSDEVMEVFTRTLRQNYGNASSIHQTGQAARYELDEARRRLATLLGSDARELVFTSGGTESDNLALFGVLRRRGPSHLVTTTIEHPAVLNVCAQLEHEGHAVTYVPVDRNGVVDPDSVRAALRSDTALVSVMHVNNELGTVQPVAEIAAVARSADALMHSDGVQACGRVPVNVRALGVDLYSVSGHKMYAPKGVGALFVRKGVELQPLLHGGRHESGRRGGTENVAGAAAIGAAAEWVSMHGAAEVRRLSDLRDQLERSVLRLVPDAVVNGAAAHRVPNVTNIRFSGVEGEAVVIALDLEGFAVSSGAACSSGAVEPSHVLTAIGLTKREAKSSIRFSLGRCNDSEQVEALAQAVARVVDRLRKLSPEYAAHV
jgi:cysteine desulfurase